MDRLLALLSPAQEDFAQYCLAKGKTEAQDLREEDLRAFLAENPRSPDYVARLRETLSRAGSPLESGAGGGEAGDTGGATLSAAGSAASVSPGDAAAPPRPEDLRDPATFTVSLAKIYGADPAALESVRVDELQLRHRGAGCLDRKGILTIADLLRLSPSDLLAIPQLGITTFSEILDKLGAFLRQAQRTASPLGGSFPAREEKPLLSRAFRSALGALLSEPDPVPAGETASLPRSTAVRDAAPSPAGDAATSLTALAAETAPQGDAPGDVFDNPAENRAQSSLAPSAAPGDSEDTANTAPAPLTPGESEGLSTLRESADLLGREICGDALRRPTRARGVCAALNNFSAPILRAIEDKKEILRLARRISPELAPLPLAPFVRALAGRVPSVDLLLVYLPDGARVADLPALAQDLPAGVEAALLPAIRETTLRLDFDSHTVLAQYEARLEEGLSAMKARTLKVCQALARGRALRELGDELNLSGERVRQIEVRFRRDFRALLSELPFDLILLLSALRGGETELSFSLLRETFGEDFSLLLRSYARGRKMDLPYFIPRGASAIVILFSGQTRERAKRRALLESGVAPLQLKITPAPESAPRAGRSKQGKAYAKQEATRPRKQKSLPRARKAPTPRKNTEAIARSRRTFPVLLPLEERESRLASLADETRVPRETIDRHFAERYSYSEGVYYRKNGAHTPFVLYLFREYFPRGYRIGEGADRARMAQLLAERFPEASVARSANPSGFDAIIAREGVPCEGDRYLPPERLALPSPALEKVRRALADPYRLVIPYEELFASLRRDLLGTEIDSPAMLRVALRHCAKDLPLEADDDFLRPAGKRAARSAVSAVEAFVRARGETHYREIASAFPRYDSLSLEEIFRKSTHLFPTSEGFYILDSAFTVSLRERAQLRTMVADATAGGPVHLRELRPQVLSRLPELVYRNSLRDEGTLFALLCSTLRGEFRFARPTISRTGDLRDAPEPPPENPAHPEGEGHPRRQKARGLSSEEREALADLAERDEFLESLAQDGERFDRPEIPVSRTEEDELPRRAAGRPRFSRARIDSQEEAPKLQELLQNAAEGRDELDRRELIRYCRAGGAPFRIGPAMRLLTPTFLLVSPDKFVRTETLGVTDRVIAAVRELLRERIPPEGYLLSASVTDYSGFPPLTIEWNAYLLEGIARLAGVPTVSLPGSREDTPLAAFLSPELAARLRPETPSKNSLAEEEKPASGEKGARSSPASGGSASASSSKRVGSTGGSGRGEKKTAEKPVGTRAFLLYALRDAEREAARPLTLQECSDYLSARSLIPKNLPPRRLAISLGRKLNE